MVRIYIQPGGATDNEDSIVQPEGSIRVDFERDELRLHNGVTPGGVRILNIEQLRQLFIARNEGLGEEVGFPSEGTGLLVRINNTPDFEVRSVAGSDSINVVNPDAVSGNVEISIKDDYLTAFLDNLTASTAEIRIAAAKYAKLSTLLLANASVEVAYSATPTFNFNNGWNFHITATGNVTLQTPANIKKQGGIIEVTASGANIDFDIAGTWADLTGQCPKTVIDGTTLYVSYHVNVAGSPVITGILGG